MKIFTSNLFIGFIQSFTVSIYCVLSSLFLKSICERLITNDLLTGALILIFFIFSATLTGILVFGYPVYLLINKKTKKALTILGYTLLTFFIIFILLILLFFNTLTTLF